MVLWVVADPFLEFAFGLLQGDLEGNDGFGQVGVGKRVVDQRVAAEGTAGGGFVGRGHGLCTAGGAAKQFGLAELLPKLLLMGAFPVFELGFP